MVRNVAATLLHLSMLALVCAIGTYWALRILTPSPASMPPPQPAAVLREADPTLAARMFGLVQAAPVSRQAMNVQAIGVYAAGKDSAAVLAVDGKPARVYLLNQEVFNGARLVEVRKDAVTIEQAGTRREVAMPVQPALGVGGPPPPAAYTREGITLTAPSVAGASQPTAPQPRPLPPRPAVAQPAVPQQPPFQPQVQLPQPQALQAEQGEPGPDESNEGGVRRPARARTQ
ncbi:MAG: hypothetical protein IPM30_01470 [Burkholderiales bacterium]|jgi:general secretion pathway protein C|nr:hypothetical protein [Burkholderiales bacterium]